MNEPVDHEEIVLTRYEKLKKWFEIIITTKKMVMFVWALIFGVTGTMAVGQITNTNPLRDGAIEVGLVDPVEPDIIEFIEKPGIPAHNHNYPEPKPFVMPEHTHKHDHPHTHPSSELEAAVNKLLPKDHRSLH